MTMTRDEHLHGSGPKRILALDGGGIRGLLSVQILKRIEEMLRQRAGGDPNFRLCDYFDLIGGTSTGAIIAASLAVGRSMQEIEALYLELGNSIFARNWKRWGVFRAKFDATPLRAALEREFGDIALGDAAVRTGLAIVMKRMDTNSPWVVHNNPRGRYFGARQGSSATPNSEYLLRTLVRASTAAPHFFDPEQIQIAPDQEGAFVDGGVSPHNNPALQLVMLATLAGHGIKWPMGEDNLMIVSVGTGSWETRTPAAEVMGMSDIGLAMRALQMLMHDVAALNETVLQWMSRSPTSRAIDREQGDLSDDVLGDTPPLSYLRYDARLEREWLAQKGNLSFSDEQIEGMRAMDQPKYMSDLTQAGAAAANEIDDRHFRPVFDLESWPKS